MREKPNRYERHQNQKALARKERAKNRHIEKQEELSGLDRQWQSYEQEVETASVSVGIIVQMRGKIFTVMEGDKYFDCILSKSLPSELGRRLVIGDIVHFNRQPGAGSGQIMARAPRKSSISRMRGDRDRVSAAAEEEHIIAANVDIGVIVAAAVNPSFHPRFVDRYLIALQNGDVKPVVCINKCDLTGERPKVIEWYRKLGIPVVETSAETGLGLDELKAKIRGKIAALVGNSGVGKSTLINKIIPGMGIDTKAVSEKTGKGRHTTTSSALYRWDKESYIIDTPGIRSLGLSNISKDQLKFGFPEFEQYASGCKFKDCIHSHEPYCAVKEAVLQGLIAPTRYESYLRMLEE